MEKAKQNLGYVIFLSVVAAIGGFLFGYDTAVISGTVQQVTQQFDLNSLQVGWFVGCALVGSISGVSIAGILSDHFGRKKTMILSALLFSVSAIGCAIASSYTGLRYLQDHRRHRYWNRFNCLTDVYLGGQPAEVSREPCSLCTSWQ